jgi:glycosyltransferase involved in cell wall biosynthesis
MGKPAEINLWIVNHYANRPGSSGLSRHYDFARYFVQKGYRVTILCADIHYNTYEKLVEIPQGMNHYVQEIEGIRYVWIRTIPYSGNGLKRYQNIYSFYLRLQLLKREKEIGRPDLIIGSSFHPFTIWAALKYKRKTGVPFIAEIRDLWPETMIQLGTSRFNPVVMLLDFIQKKVYKESDAIVLLFPKAYEYINSLQLGISSEKMNWIPNGVDVEQFSKPQYPTELVVDPNFFNVLNGGSLGNVYALEYLMQAAVILQNKKLPVHIYMLGSGPLEAKLKQMKVELKLENVFFKKSLPKVLMPAVLAQFDLLYASLMNSPLYKYGMSLTKLHEYMAAGKPIVFAVNAVNNPVNDSGCGFTVDSNDAAGIASAIERMYELSTEERQEMGNKAYKHALANFDYSALSTKYDTLIRRIITGGQGQNN